MDLPLVQHGPSASYGTAYFCETTEGVSRIIAVDGGKIDSPVPSTRKSEPRNFFDRFFKIDRVFFSPAAAAEEAFAALPNCETPKRKPRRSKFSSTLTTIQTTFDLVTYKVNQLALFGRSTPLRKDHGHEPHTETTRSCRSHPRMQEHTWVFTHDARTGRPTRRQQSDSIRTCSSSHPKRGAHARTQQSSLFIDC